ncbi:ABC transporter ATP-binding protein [Gordonia humi]|uniref:ATP-binding cassette subfamily B protein n=1 Tax=Gordonia humi TaxID=686429 RepID=A0A840FCG1_9ACTN|nr:ABC transporter ATP-binding protein [Gordonia humi]MBB4137800.1 ATP-binding cassette subfamily B protein [Gordonia humi]
MISELLSVLDRDTVRGYRAQIVRSVIYAVLEGITIALTLPTLAAVVAGDTDASVRWLIALAVLAAATLLAHAHTVRKGTRATFDAMAAVQSLEVAQLRRVPLAWFGATNNAGLISLLWPGAISITRNILLNLGELARGLITPVIVLIAAAFVSPAAAVVMVIAAPCMFLVHRITTRRLEEAERADHAANTEATARVIEYAEAQPVLRSADRNNLGMRLLTDSLDELDAAARVGVRTEILARAGFGTAVNVAISAVVAVVGWAMLGTGADLAALVALLTLSLRFTEPVMAVATTARMLRTSRATVRRTVDYLRIAPLPEPGDPQILPAEGPLSVTFDGVDFTYPGADEPTLTGVDLTVPAGTVTAVVGPSGAGKSTLLRLVPRFADVDSGAIRLGDVDVRATTTDRLYPSVGMILPEVTLLDRSIRDNVTAFRPDATDEELAWAAQVSGVDEIVERLPGGWDAPVGPLGGDLSGGERQRVQIARVALQRPAVVVLDEATAALDTLSEQKIQAWVRGLAGRATVIVVAHRMRIVDDADQVVVVQNGRIVESGTADELRAADGAFARMRRTRSDTSEWALDETEEVAP